MNRHSGDHEQRAQWDAVVTALRRGQRIAITSHIDPDPDSIGSCLAVWHGLLSLDKQPVVVMADEVPHYLRFLSGADEILTLGRGQKNLLGDDRRFDTLVVVDCEPERTGGILPEELGDIVVVNIDHHVSNEAQVDHKVLVPQAAATAELIGQLLAQLQVPLTGESAQCLLAGLIGDTGSFAYGNTTPETHRFAAQLLEVGANSEEIHQQLFETVPFEFPGMLCRVLQRLHRSDDGRVAWIEIPLELVTKMKEIQMESERIVRYARMIQGVEVAALIREIAPGECKVSLRSKAEVDVSQVAASLGGGGHRKAAGCTVTANLDETRDRVLAAIDQFMD